METGNEQRRLSDVLIGLADLKKIKTMLADQTKENDKRIKAQEELARSLILDIVEKTGIEVNSFKCVVDGRSYGLTVKPMYSIPAPERDEAFKKLRELGLGDLIVEKVDDRTLTSALNDIAAGNDGKLPDEYLEIPLRTFDKYTISDRKA